MKQSFHQLASVARLHEFAATPIDLTQEGILTPSRVEAMCSEQIGLTLLWSTERITDACCDALCALASETKAVEKMHAMQSGEVVNRIEGVESENRPALHTAMRDFFGERSSSEPARKAAELAYGELEKLKQFLHEIDENGTYTDIVQIGIGGSELGPKAVYIALETFRKEGRRVHFLSNVDPDEGAKIFSELSLDKTLVVVVSKSGTTLETLTNEQFAREKYAKAGLRAKDHFLAVTGEGSPMDNPAEYRARFMMWDYIGGRYSVTSMVGAVSLAFAIGMERFLEFLKGAHAMDKVALQPDPKKNLPLFSALLGIWNRNFLDLPTVAVIPYSAALSRFSAHLQQLDMESNGKQIDKQGEFVDYQTGPIIWGEPGTNGQHSFYQSIHQGTTVVPLEFIGFKESQTQDDILFQESTCQEKLLANLFAQMIALATGQKSSNPNRTFLGNRPSRLLLGQRLDPQTMGKILAFYEHKVAFQGFIWNINSFDQEGVQLGKKLALKIIDQWVFLRNNKEAQLKIFPLGAAFLKFCRK